MPLPAAAELAAFAPRRSPSFYILRSSCALAADVAVDGMRVAYGTLSKHAFRQNALLKLLKHGLSCACCIAAGAPQGLRGVDPALAEHTARQYEQWDADHGVVDHDPEWEAYLRLLKRIQPDFEGCPELETRKRSGMQR